MAVALPGATLPAVVEELLSEMAAAVQENARSTGRRASVAALWAADLARPGGEARGGVRRACGAPVGALTPLSSSWPLRAFPLWLGSQTPVRGGKKEKETGFV